jgi:high-affinity Fe2+/Pb2+ permease
MNLTRKEKTIISSLIGMIMAIVIGMLLAYLSSEYEAAQKPMSIGLTLCSISTFLYLYFNT